jgi:capsular polysaccharide biosynthesis protein
VFGIRSELAPKQYAASVVTEIRPAGEIVPGDAFIEQMRAPFMGLAVDKDVLRQVLTQVNTDWDTATLEKNVQLAPGPSPALLVFTVTAPSPELAGEIARAMVLTVAQASFANHTRDVARQTDQLQASIAAEEARIIALPADDPARTASQQYLEQLRNQLTTLQSSGGDELSVLATPEQSAGPVSPKPMSEAMVAALAAFIVAIEFIVLWRSRMGNKTNRTWARRISYKYRSQFDPRATPGENFPNGIAAKLAQYQRERRDVLVLLGTDAVMPFAGAPGPESFNGHRRTQTVMPLGGTWWQQIDLTDTVLAVVIVTTDSSDRAAAEEALHQLADFGVPSALVLQRRQRARSDRPSEPNGPPSGPAQVPSTQGSVERHV